MNLRIHRLNQKDNMITSQLSESWRNVDLKHFGKEVDEWRKEDFFYYAENDGEVIGYVYFKVEMGVSYVHELIVSDNHRRKGVGRMLMQELEETSKVNGAHIVYLTTGKNWNERKFYEAIGYAKSADLPNHYLGIDFIHLTKEL